MNINISKSTQKNFLIHKTSYGNIGMFFEGILLPFILTASTMVFVLSIHFYEIRFDQLVIIFLLSVFLYKSIKMHRFTVLEKTSFNRNDLYKMAERNNWKVLKNSDNTFIADVKSRYWFTTIYLIVISNETDTFILLYPETFHLKAIRFPIPRIIKEKILIEIIKGFSNP